VFGSLYTKGDLSCSPCSLVEQRDIDTFALAAPPRSAGSKLLLLPNEDARAMQVAVLCDTRTAYFIYLLEPARLVTNDRYCKREITYVLTIIDSTIKSIEDDDKYLSDV